MSKVKKDASELCPFCQEIKTSFHMFLEFNCLETLFIVSLKTVEWLGLQWQWVDTTFILLVKYRVKVEFQFYSLMNNLTEFSSQWCVRNVVCSVIDGRLYFSPMFM